MNAMPYTSQRRCAAALPGAGRVRARIAPPGCRIEATCRCGASAFDL